MCLRRAISTTRATAAAVPASLPEPGQPKQGSPPYRGGGMHAGVQWPPAGSCCGHLSSAPAPGRPARLRPTSFAAGKKKPRQEAHSGGRGSSKNVEGSGSYRPGFGSIDRGSVVAAPAGSYVAEPTVQWLVAELRCEAWLLINGAIPEQSECKLPQCRGA